MPIEVKQLIRRFNYNGMDIPDPNPSASTAQCVAILSATYPELATAKIEPAEETTEAGVTVQTHRLKTQAKTKG